MSRVSLEEAVARLAAGEVVALPTETVYGLAADALDPRALARIYATKGRPADHPLILHGVAPGRPGPGALGYGGPDPRADELARRFWPGPLTLVLLRTAVVPLVLTGGHDTVAVRAPAHPLFEEVLRRLVILLDPSNPPCASVEGAPARRCVGAKGRPRAGAEEEAIHRLGSRAV